MVDTHIQEKMFEDLYLQLNEKFEKHKNYENDDIHSSKYFFSGNDYVLTCYPKGSLSDLSNNVSLDYDYVDQFCKIRVTKDPKLSYIKFHDQNDIICLFDLPYYLDAEVYILSVMEKISEVMEHESIFQKTLKKSRFNTNK